MVVPAARGSANFVGAGSGDSGSDFFAVVVDFVVGHGRRLIAFENLNIATVHRCLLSWPLVQILFDLGCQISLLTVADKEGDASGFDCCLASRYDSSCPMSDSSLLLPDLGKETVGIAATAQTTIQQRE
ncbi:hypothetical protein ACLOJK_033314, partial [Asimina triloba]